MCIRDSLNDEWRYRIAIKTHDMEGARNAVRTRLLPAARNDRKTRLVINVDP